jgi:phage tail sheath protein FI
MPQYLAPGVFIEEVPGAKPIEGVGTATGAFVGIAEKGPIGEAELVTNWTQFVETFGSYVPYGYLAYAINHFFTEGGTRCFVVRTCHYDSNNLPTASAGSLTLRDAAATGTLKIDALSAGSWSDHLWIEVAQAKKDPANKFRLVVWYKGSQVEFHEELTKASVLGTVNTASKYVHVMDLPVSTQPPVFSRLARNDAAAAPQATIAVTALEDGLGLAITRQPINRFSLFVIQAGAVVDRTLNVSMTDVEAKVNGISDFIKVENLKSTNTANAPAATSSVLNDRAAAPLPTLAVTALADGLTLDVEDGTAADTFKLTVKRGAATLETFDNLTIDSVESDIDGVSPNIDVRSLVSVTAAPDNRPANAAGVALPPPVALTFFGLSGGDDGLADGVPLNDAAAAASLQINAFREGVQVSVSDATSGAAKFKLTVLVNGVAAETFDELIMDTVEDEVNGQSRYIEVMQRGANRPATTAAAVDVPIGLADNDFIGDAATKNGLHAFDPVDDINIMAIPDRPGDREVTLAAYTYCENRKDCFFVADPPLGLGPQQVLAYKSGTGDFVGNAFNSSYAALYYPWILVTDPLSGGNRLAPPSGAVVGTYSATDVARGVHKAPAGTIDGYLNSAMGIERLITKGEQELLNPEQVNVIRSFPAAGIVVWGARTLSADPEFRYINVRRLLLFIEESIEKSTQWVVFEPNDRSLWARLKRDVSAFLNIVWKSGALFGSTAEEAFFVKIDDENNPPEMRDAGRLNIDIGVAPVKPAEFVIFRVSQKTASAG